ncbi:MAG: hypothetical protein AAF531_00100 [Actinomycetota bacterium]
MILASVAAALTAAACTNGDDDFADGREVATIWLVTPTPFSEDNGQAQLDRIAEVFDWPHTRSLDDTFLTGPVDGTGWNRRGYTSPNGDGGVIIDNLDKTWSYATDDYHTDQFCHDCTPLPFDRDEALRRATVVLEAVGLDPSDYSFRTVAVSGDGGPDVSLTVLASLVVGGVSTDITWSVNYRNSDGALALAGGHFVSAVELGDVPLLKPQEALEGVGREATADVVGRTELILESRYDRESNQRLLVPAYAVPVTDDLDVTVTIAATRAQDLPSPDQVNDLIDDRSDSTGG